MSEYAGLPLNTPTKIRETADYEIWATRTANGGTVEARAIGASAVAASNLASVMVKAQQALGLNATYLALATPTAAQNTAQVKRLTREVNGLIRLLLSELQDVSDT